MKLLIVDPAIKGGAGGLDLAIRAQKHGHQVKYFSKRTSHAATVGAGLTSCCSDFRPWLRWADLIFNCDSSMYLVEMEAARKEGKAVVSANTETAKWERDKEYGASILRKGGTSVPEFKIFTSANQAERYVSEHLGRHASKPIGPSNGDSLSYRAQSARDMVHMLRRWGKMGKLSEPHAIQEFVTGVDMAVGGWFGPDGFNRGWCENFKCDGGVVARYVETSKLANTVLVPLAESLDKAKHVGYVEVNCVLDEDGKAWALNIKTSPSWHLFSAMQPLHEGDCIEWMKSLAEGEDGKGFDFETVSVGVELSIQDYRASQFEPKAHLSSPIYNLTTGLWQSFHPCEVKQGSAPMESKGLIVDCPCLCTAGSHLGVMTSTGECVKEARDKMYRRVSRLHCPSPIIFRLDIGQRLLKQLPAIQPQGYARALQYYP